MTKIILMCATQLLSRFRAWIRACALHVYIACDRRAYIQFISWAVSIVCVFKHPSPITNVIKRICILNWFVVEWHFLHLQYFCMYSTTVRIPCSQSVYMHDIVLSLSTQDEVTAPYSVAFHPHGSKIYCGFHNCIRIFDVTHPGRQSETRSIFSELLWRSLQLILLKEIMYCHMHAMYLVRLWQFIVWLVTEYCMRSWMSTLRWYVVFISCHYASSGFPALAFGNPTYVQAP